MPKLWFQVSMALVVVAIAVVIAGTNARQLRSQLAVVEESKDDEVLPACQMDGETCNAMRHCCSGLQCNDAKKCSKNPETKIKLFDDGSLGVTQQGIFPCLVENTVCDKDSKCCTGLSCKFAPREDICQRTCGVEGYECESNADCCSFMECRQGNTKKVCFQPKLQ